MLILNEHSPHPGILPLPAMRLPYVAIAVLLCSASMPAQSTSPAAQNSPSDHASLHDYESCGFDDGLQIVKIDSLPPGPQERTITTLEGPKVIHMLDGRRILFAYGVSGNYFANVKPELLPEDMWAVQKSNLLDEVQAMQRADFNMRPNTGLPATMHGLEVHGFDRVDLNGDTLGFYLLFDDTRHIATSIYFLNQQPLTRRFQTIEQYRNLRTRFLAAYTGCVEQNQSLRATTKNNP
jgi:hypothetical protein